MASLQLSDLRTQVRVNLNESTASYWADSDINTHLLNAYHQIMSVVPVVKTITGTIAANAQTFNLPSDWAQTVGFFVNNQPVSLSTPRELGFAGVVWTDPTLTKNDKGQPYAVFVSSFDASNNPVWTLYPYADQSYSYTLYYMPQDAGLAVDSSTPIFRTDWQWVLVDYATWRCWMKGGRDMEAAEIFHNYWLQDLVNIEWALLDSTNANWVIRHVDDRSPALQNPANNPLEIAGL